MTRLALLTALALAMTALPSRSALPPPSAKITEPTPQEAFHKRITRSNAEAVKTLLNADPPRTILGQPVPVETYR